MPKRRRYSRRRGRRDYQLAPSMPMTGVKGQVVTRYFRTIHELNTNVAGELAGDFSFNVGTIGLNAEFNRFRQEYRLMRLEKATMQIFISPITANLGVAPNISPIAFCPVFADYGNALTYTDVVNMPACKFLGLNSTSPGWVKWRRRNYDPYTLFQDSSAAFQALLGGFVVYCDTGLAANYNVASVTITYKVSFVEPKYQN